MNPRLSDMTLPAPILADLTRFGNRASVVLVLHDGREALRKTLKRHALRYLRREVEALQVLASTGKVPRILFVEKNYFVMEKLDEVRMPSPSRELLPPRTVHSVRDFIKTSLSLSIDPIDVTPGNNILLTFDGDVRVIDCEFTRRLPHEIPAAEAYLLHGVPNEYDGDVPFGVNYSYAPYYSEWYSYTGSDRDTFLKGGATAQRLRRSRTWVEIALGGVKRHLKSWLAGGASGLQSSPSNRRGGGVRA